MSVGDLGKRSTRRAEIQSTTTTVSTADVRCSKRQIDVKGQVLRIDKTLFEHNIQHIIKLCNIVNAQSAGINAMFRTVKRTVMSDLRSQTTFELACSAAGLVRPPGSEVLLSPNRTSMQPKLRQYTPQYYIRTASAL